MSAADFGRSAPPAPKRSPAPARPPMDPQFAARLRELQLKGLDVADGILDKLKGEQAPPEGRACEARHADTAPRSAFERLRRRPRR